MITRSAVETKEQKMYFSPQQVEKDIRQMSEVLGCTIEEATELEQFDYQEFSFPTSSRERWITMARHVQMTKKADRRPRTKELNRYYKNAEEVYSQFYAEADQLFGPLIAA